MEGNHEMRVKMEKMLRDAQISITKAIQEIDGEAEFQEDGWVRETGGGGTFGHRMLCRPALTVMMH